MSAAEFIARTTGKGRRQIHYDVTIDGVPGVLTDRADEATPSAPAIDGRAMIVDWEESAVTLDRRQRIQTGGGAVIRLQDRSDALLSLFAVRTRRATFITANISASDVTVTVRSTASLPSSGVVYVAAETIAYTGKTATTLTGCTRGAHGSRAQAHRGGAEQGTGVFAVPPSWIGRRVRVTGYFDDDDGVRDSASATELGVFRLEESPTPDGAGGWELRCSHLTDEIAKRKLGTGIVEVKAAGDYPVLRGTSAGVDYLDFRCPKGVGRLFKQRSTALGQTQVMVGFDGFSAIFDIVDVDLTSSGWDLIRTRLRARSSYRIGTVALTTERFDSGATDDDTVMLMFDTVKHVCILEGAVPYVVALAALTSSLGDGTGGTYDVLPGADPTTLGEAGFRLGAGVPLAEIDEASLLATAIGVPSSWSYPVDGEIPLTDFLRDFCRESNSAAIISRAGMITFTPLLVVRATAVATIAEADCYGAITSTILEDETYSRVEVACNYDPLDGDYEASITVIDQEIAATYAPRENTLVIESRSIVVHPVSTQGQGSLVRSSVDIGMLLPVLRREMVSYRGGALVVTARLSAKHVLLNLGDLVALSFPSVSDRRGGLLASAIGRIVERTNEWRSGDLSITVSVIVEERLSHFAPHAAIASVAAPIGPLQSVTLSTADIGGDATPTRSFRVGDVLTVVSATGLTVESGHAEVASITSDTVMVVQAGPVGDALPLVAGEFLLLRLSTVVTASVDGFLETDYTYHDGQSIASSATSRWR